MRTRPHSLTTGIAWLALQLVAATVAQGSSLDATHEPSRPVAEDAALLEKGRIHAQQKALVRLGMQTDPEADKVLRAQLERYRAGQLAPALWLELFEAIAKRPNADLQARLAEVQRGSEKSADPLAQFHECLRGGDGESGRQIFTTKVEAGCIRCHSVEGQGGQIGPELTWLRHSVERLNILESIILPNATIAEGFGSALLKLKSGEEVFGVLTQENDTDVIVTSTADAKKRRILIADIVERTPLPSPMPPQFGQVLSKREIRDLVEYLAEGD
ncbi:MAG: c-type cytochrome [Chthoniobacter sp.]|nr:c-type cytochrome [Chthoniobacter sp.]